MVQKLLSQNFLWNRELVGKLVRNSSISKNDLVVEIGPGRGIITEQLLDVSKELTAVEADETLFNLLNQRFAGDPRLTLINKDFLKFTLPDGVDYKVFSNIPFSVTGEIIKKLIFAKNPPTDSYLVVQNEAAEKFTANDGQNTMLAVLAYPWFEIQKIHKFSRSDFKPSPKVDSVLLRMRKRESPLISPISQSFYHDYVVYQFTRDRVAKQLTPKAWLANFEGFIKEGDPRKQSRIRGSFEKWRAEERKLTKIHRTRLDTDWKEYSN